MFTSTLIISEKYHTAQSFGAWLTKFGFYFDQHEARSAVSDLEAFNLCSVLICLGCKDSSRQGRCIWPIKSKLVEQYNCVQSIPFWVRDGIRIGCPNFSDWILTLWKRYLNHNLFLILLNYSLIEKPFASCRLEIWLSVYFLLIAIKQK